MAMQSILNILICLASHAKWKNLIFLYNIPAVGHMNMNGLPPLTSPDQLAAKLLAICWHQSHVFQHSGDTFQNKPS